MRLKALKFEEANTKTKELFQEIDGKLGMVPNMMRTMGNSPAVLDGYLKFSDALAKGSLGVKLRELIALAMAESNACNYCLSIHSFIGEKVVNMDKDTLESAREGRNPNPKIEAALTFVKTLMEKNGKVDDGDVEAVKRAGYTHGEITEIIAHVSLNMLTNYLNNTANTQVDFPLVEARSV